jgi:hypothetical protein
MGRELGTEGGGRLRERRLGPLRLVLEMTVYVESQVSISVDIDQTT